MPQAGVVGSPIAHSLSPALHYAAYEALGLTGWQYHRHEVASGELATYVAGLPQDWMGVSVTMPGKEEALALASEAGERAILAGAANTLVRSSSGWRAENTDVHGIIAALTDLDREGHEASGQPSAAQHSQRPWKPDVAGLLGSGATARSALVALAQMGASEIHAYVRSQVRQPTRELAQRLGVQLVPRALEDLPAELASLDAIVSTVPAGATPEVSQVTVDHELRALDVVYAPWPTPFAQALTAAGAHVQGGGAMLVHQAVEQVQLMTGHTPPVGALEAAWDRAVSGR